MASLALIQLRQFVAMEDWRLSCPAKCVLNYFIERFFALALDINEPQVFPWTEYCSAMRRAQSNYYPMLRELMHLGYLDKRGFKSGHRQTYVLCFDHVPLSKLPSLPQRREVLKKKPTLGREIRRIHSPKNKCFKTSENKCFKTPENECSESPENSGPPYSLFPSGRNSEERSNGAQGAGGGTPAAGRNGAEVSAEKDLPEKVKRGLAALRAAVESSQPYQSKRERLAQGGKAKASTGGKP